MADVSGGASLHGVTSDCRPWPRIAGLAVCGCCGSVQKRAGAVFETDAAEIYAGYDIYHQARGVEQAVFAAGSGQPCARSERLAQRLCEATGLPAKGRLLDVGCGNGAFLRAFSAVRGGWTLAGTEVGERHRAKVEAIAGVEGFHTCGPADVPGRFDLISAIHVLEHVVNPLAFLAGLREKLMPGGLLLVEVPDHTRNPFDLVIADHCTHFSDGTLRQSLQAAGFETAAASAGWVAKELSAVVRPNAAGAASLPRADPGPSMRAASSGVRWLRKLLELGRGLAETGPFGLFGTSIAAIWAFSAFFGQVAFFVDEDPARAGRDLLGRRIHEPGDAPADRPVLLALAPEVADSVSKRLKSRYPRLQLVMPPA